MNSIIMGFDFGLKRIGVAVGQKVTQTASGLTVVQACDGIPRWEYLDKIVLDWQPEKFIVGLPLNMDGSKSEMSQKAHKFSRRMSSRYNIQSEMFDERLTSFEAREHEEKTHIDAIAARLILESWLRE
ncbi:MAG: Holliday junction resolvase RuvX [Pseudomonadota bacterium]|nr:Holliday junction resolvase RuvX [Gammaproteobacteria bacterium]MEC8644961.1 Holliday junction resolvase RuvX [Pseudomonadota bacterium]|tara:strand:+ start:1164 stop:1547 length:384 start_codon:yes stop_codon:yes gene_type:complete